MRHPILALVFSLSLLGGSAAAQRTMVRDELPVASSGPDTVVETEHYLLRVQGPAADGAELGRVLEAAHEQFRALFRAAPRDRRGERVTVHLVPERESWLARMRAAGCEPPSNADFAHYHPEGDAVFVYRQRSAWLTRAVLIHGACQRFHRRCKPKNRDLVRTWIPMGLGDHLAVHTWDGETLALGASPLVDPGDMMGQALERLDPERFDPAQLYEQGMAHSEVCFAIVRYTLDAGGRSQRKAFEKLALGYTGSKLHASTYAAKLGEPVQLTGKLLVWLAENQSPLRIATGDWEDRGAGRIVGSTSVRASDVMVDFKHPFELLRLRLPIGEPSGSIAGVTFDHESTQTWHRLFVLPDGVWIRQMRNGALAREYVLPVVGDEAVEVELRRDGDGFLVNAGGEQLRLDDVPGQRPGLFVRDGPLQIEVLELR